MAQMAGPLYLVLVISFSGGNGSNMLHQWVGVVVHLPEITFLGYLYKTSLVQSLKWLEKWGEKRSVNDGNGSTASSPGGGGGGAYRTSSNTRNGGSGANGKVVVTYGAGE
jgi:hypothetical protein